MSAQAEQLLRRRKRVTRLHGLKPTGQVSWSVDMCWSPMARSSLMVDTS